MKKKKENQEAKNMAEREPFKRFQDYNLTLLNASAREVLMEIKKDPMYQKPRKIFEKPPDRMVHKYCAFHDSNGHGTETCAALRTLIKKFIAKGPTKHDPRPPA